jgi:hypothetical protein
MNWNMKKRARYVTFRFTVRNLGTSALPLNGVNHHLNLISITSWKATSISHSEVDEWTGDEC